jgi:TnsA endonuclease N terminal
VRLDTTTPVREPSSYSRGITGRATVRGRTHSYESRLEAGWLSALDFDWRVTRIETQPFTVAYHDGADARRYTPDVYVEFDDGEREWVEVHEVKPRKHLTRGRDAARRRCGAVVAHCKARGWHFRVITEALILTPYVDNVKFLLRYRREPDNPIHRIVLERTLRLVGPTTVGELVDYSWEAHEDRCFALAQVWRLVAFGFFAVAPLHKPLTMLAEIWIAGEHDLRPRSARLARLTPELSP